MMYWISRSILEIFLRIFFKVRFLGRENIPDPPYMIVSNHTSALDPPLVGVACKKNSVDFLAKEELFNIPVLGVWTRSVNCICVRRGASNVGGLKEALRRIHKGRSVCIFPEGTRSADGSLQEAKRGVGFLIARAGVPVVPVYVDGSRAAFPKSGSMKPGTRIDVFIGKPILPEDFLSGKDYGKKDYEAVTNMIMERIALVKDTADYPNKYGQLR